MEVYGVHNICCFPGLEVKRLVAGKISEFPVGRVAKEKNLIWISQRFWNSWWWCPPVCIADLYCLNRCLLVGKGGLGREGAAAGFCLLPPRAHKLGWASVPQAKYITNTSESTAFPASLALHYFGQPGLWLWFSLVSNSELVLGFSAVFGVSVLTVTTVSWTQVIFTPLVHHALCVLGQLTLTDSDSMIASWLWRMWSYFCKICPSWVLGDDKYLINMCKGDSQGVQ